FSDAEYRFNLTALSGFNETVSMSIEDVPAGASVLFSSNTIVPSGSIDLTLGNLTAATSGRHVIRVVGTAASQTVTQEIVLNLDANVPTNAPGPTAPANGAKEVELEALLSWNALSDASSYVVEIASSPAFGNTLLQTIEVNGNSHTCEELDRLSVYYWRVKGRNSCGDGTYSSTFSFQTGQPDCFEYTATDLPITIDDGPPGQISSQIVVNHDVNITDVNVKNLQGTHSYIQDLTFRLFSPSGTERILFQNVCGSNDDFDLTLDDTGSTMTCPINTAAVHQAQQSLSLYNGSSSAGTWTLFVTDGANEDGGSLNAWSLEICSDPITVVNPAVVSNNTLIISAGNSATIGNSLLNVTHSSSSVTEVRYLLTALTEGGTLSLNGTTLSIGDSFTQSDINNNLLAYTHSGAAGNSDDFEFDIIANNGGWLAAQVFSIEIQNESISVEAGITMEIDCHGAATGAIAADPGSGTAPYSYSIDGVNFQSSSEFTNLTAGNYTITIKDNDDNTGTTSITLTEPNELSIEANVEDHTITVSAEGGTGNLLYQIDGGALSANNVFTNLDNGSYTLSVVDANDCTISTSATVAVADLVVEAEVMRGISCHNEQDAEVEVYASGGVPPYQYSMNGTDFQTSEVFSNLAAGNYTFYVKDAREATQNSESILLDQPEQLEAAAVSVEEQITVNASGGSGAMRYSIDGVNFQDNNTFTNLNNGSYTLTVKDANDCTTTTTATVSYNNLVVEGEIIASVSCHDAADGIVDVYVSGGTAPFSYSLDGENFQSEARFSNLSADTYEFTVKDANNFTQKTSAILVSQPTAITLEATPNGNSVSLTADGGTAPYRFSIDGVNFQRENTFNDLENGDHILLVQDANECISSTTVSINFNNILVELNVSKPISCRGNKDATISVSASGGAEPYLYSIDGGEQFQESVDFSFLAAGTYVVTVKDAEGFEKESSSITIEDPALIIVETTVNANTVTVLASGGTGDYVYSVDGSNFQNSPVFEGLAVGDYIVTVKDGNNCRALGIVSITTTTNTHELENDF
ncbi:MAG: proprotein convertase P-domain-containing protein, partial [Bacteroidota bacterium]